MEYCTRCFDCENCFGCVGLRRKKFCILNKQYFKDEYWKVLDELKCRLLEEGDYGDIPGLRFSTQHWSSLLDLFEIDKATAMKLGGRDFDLTSGGAEGLEIAPEMILPLETIPDRLSSDDYENLPGKFYFDPLVGRRFSFLKPELAMYQKLKVAPPRQHPRTRIMETYKRSNKPEFFDTKCKKCNKEIRVAKNSGFPNRRIYCRECYLKFLEENN
jgi:hypothetical protein